MEQYIPKSALVAEIERRLEFVEKRLKRNNSYTEEGNTSWERDKALYDAYNSLLHFLNTLEVKEVDLEKETDKWYNNEASKEFENVLYKDIEKCAKHFFELGLSVSNSAKVTTPDIDDVLKENGVNPYSKEAKIIKESYFMAIEKLAQKGE